MTQPRLYFQGFDGARKVQSMMIDFPELRFISDKDGLEISSITIETLRASRFLARCTVRLTVHLLTNRTMYINGLNLSADDTTSKIFVFPECEGFFDLLHEDFTADFESAHRIYVEDGKYGFAGDVEHAQYKGIGYQNCLFSREAFEEIYPMKELRVWQRNGKRIWMPLTDTDVGQ